MSPLPDLWPPGWLAGLTFAQQHAVAVAVGLLSAVPVYAWWRWVSPFRSDPAFSRDTETAAAAITTTGEIPPTRRRAAAAAAAAAPPRQESRRTLAPPRSPVVVLGADRAAELLTRVRQEMAADPRLDGHQPPAGLTWLIDSAAPAARHGQAVADDYTYALIAGHVLAGGWALSVPDDVLLPILQKMAAHRQHVVAEATAPGPPPVPVTPADAPAAPAVPAASMYDRVGPAAVGTLVERLYSALRGDEVTAGFFTGIDMTRLRRHQAALVSQLLGGRAHVTDSQLAEAHAVLRPGGDASLVIDNRVYARTCAHALGAAWTLGLPEDVTRHLVVELVGKRRLITEASRRGAERHAAQGRAAGTLLRPLQK